MAFTDQEKQLLIWAKQNGKTATDTELALAKLRAGIVETPPAQAPGRSVTADLAIGAAKGAGSSIKGTADAVASTIPSMVAGPLLSSFPQVRNSIASTVDRFKEMLFGAIGLTDENLKAENTAQKIGKGAAFAAEMATPFAAAKAPRAATAVVNVAKSAAERASKALPSSESMSGLRQSATEFAERVPRFVGRVKEAVQEASERSTRIRESAPAVQTAIKTNLDDRIIRTVEAADNPTLQAYKEIIDLSENTGKTLKVTQRPEIVAGKAAETQYKLIEQQRKTVGRQIGEAVTKLSKTTKADMSGSVAQMDDVLETQGIKILRGEEGVQLDFTGTRFTPAERSKINELYRLATEGGSKLTPAQIHQKDQLFSKLQREARFEGIGDIFVETPQGNMSLFRVFRDIYTNKLDDVSPDNIRSLNKEYRNLVTLIDDIENSIIKGGNFERSASIDPAEFAQTNLRRVLSDAQSAAVYKEILSEMDTLSRELGYKGAKAEDLIAFATEMRKLYNTAIPATSFQGGIRASISDLLQTVTSVGKPNTADQQRALRALIESRLSTSTQ